MSLDTSDYSWYLNELDRDSLISLAHSLLDHMSILGPDSEVDFHDPDNDEYDEDGDDESYFFWTATGERLI